jgi:hypothetical protein
MHRTDVVHRGRFAVTVRGVTGMLSSMFVARHAVIEMISVGVMPSLECALRFGGGDCGRLVLTIDTECRGRVDAAHLSTRRGCRQRVRASGRVGFLPMAELPRLDPRRGLRRSLMSRVGVGSSRLHLPAMRCVWIGRRRLRVSRVGIRRRGLRVLRMAGLRVPGCCSVLSIARGTRSRVSPVHAMAGSRVIHSGVIHRGVVHLGVVHLRVIHPGVVHRGVVHPRVIHPIHPGVIHPFHPGVIHRGVVHPGVIHRGVVHSGVIHRGVVHSGVVHPGVIHRGVVDPINCRLRWYLPATPHAAEQNEQKYAMEEGSHRTRSTHFGGYVMPSVTFGMVTPAGAGCIRLSVTTRLGTILPLLTLLSHRTITPFVFAFHRNLLC